MIRTGTIEDIEKIYQLADQFSKASKFVSYTPAILKRTWKYLFDSGLGVLLVDDIDGHIVGTLGGMKSYDPHNGIPFATEFFWFVDEKYRGSGIRLFKRFEQWAKENGCCKVIMVYLSDLMPEKIKRVYERFGYVPLETHYIKEL